MYTVYVIDSPNTPYIYSYSTRLLRSISRSGIGIPVDFHLSRILFARLTQFNSKLGRIHWILKLF
jgi:hypothetical protein